MKFSIRSKNKNDGRRQGLARPEAEATIPTYRRNRTMTDRSTIPEVSERARIHHLRAVRRKIGLMLLAIGGLFFIVLIGVSQFSSSVRIAIHGDAGISRTVDERKYQELFDKYYGKHPLDRFRFLTDIKQLTESMQAEAPEVKAIASSAMERIGVSRYELVVRRPVASWTVDSERYYVDADGVTFRENYFTDPKVSVVDNSGAQVVQGSAIASSRLLSFVGRVVSLSQDKDIDVTSIEIPSESMRQVHIKGEGIPTVKMTIDKEAEGQVEDMSAALKYFKQKDQSPRYIDVRASGRVFYR